MWWLIAGVAVVGLAVAVGLLRRSVRIEVVRLRPRPAIKAARPLPLGPPPMRPVSRRGGEPLIRVADDVIEHEIRTGNLLNAVKLYREQTGVGLLEAKEAVEAWKHRLRAS